MRRTPNLNFGAIVERAYRNGIACGVCYIISEKPQSGLRLTVSGAEPSRIYLNGRQIHQSVAIDQSAGISDKNGGIALNTRVDVLIFKV